MFGFIRALDLHALDRSWLWVFIVCSAPMIPNVGAVPVVKLMQMASFLSVGWWVIRHPVIPSRHPLSLGIASGFGGWWTLVLLDTCLDVPLSGSLS